MSHSFPTPSRANRLWDIEWKIRRRRRLSFVHFLFFIFQGLGGKCPYYLDPVKNDLTGRRITRSQVKELIVQLHNEVRQSIHRYCTHSCPVNKCLLVVLLIKKPLYSISFLNRERNPDRILRNADQLYVPPHATLKRMPLYNFPYTWNQEGMEKFNPIQHRYLKHVKAQSLRNL
jgi:hypothetical protein